MRRSLWFLLLAACGDNRRAATVVMDVSVDAPAYGRAPWPSDAYRGAPITGLERITPAKADLLAEHLGALDGWGLRPTIEFFIDGAIDPATVPATTSALTDALVLVDVDERSAGRGVPIAMDWRYDPDRSEIIGSPHLGATLDEGTTYAAVLTRDVRAADGEPLYPAGLDRIAADPPARWQATADALVQLRATSQLKDRIAGVAVFTTQHASDSLVRARTVLAATAPPALAFGDPSLIFDTPQKLDALLGRATRDTSGPRAGLEQWGTDNPTGIAHDHVAVVATGTITIARFRRLDDGMFGPDDGTFATDANGTPIVQSIDPIPVTFVLPTGTMPANGWPVVIWGHGLGGSRTSMMNMAEPWTEQGYAIVAIDMWGHGSRYNPTDLANNFSFSRPGFTGDPNLHDGFGDDTGNDTEIAFFESFQNFAAIRDSMKQSALDFARLATLVQQSPDLAPLAGAYGGIAPKLDRTRVAYAGESFGTVVGTELAAIEPSIDLYILDVPGGGILDYILPNSPEITSLAIPFVQSVYRTQGTVDRFHPMVGVVQAVFDGADPLTFAPHVLANRLTIAGAQLGPRSVVCIEALHDEIMSNAGTSALARNFGLSVLTPDLDPPEGLAEVASPVSANIDGQTGVLVQYWPATHGYNWSAAHGQLAYQLDCPCPGDDPFPKLPAPVTIDEPIYPTQAQVIEILQTHTQGLPPRVRSTLPPDPNWTP